MRAVILFLLLINTAAAQGIPWQAWEYREAMSESAWQYFGPSAPIAALAAQIHQESGWRCDAVSWAGAQGCGQFMPGTAKDMAARFPAACAPANPFSPEWAFRCRDLYLRSLIRASRTAGTDHCSALAFGLRAYNGGLGWIRKDRALAAKDGSNSNDWLAVQPYNAGRSPSAYRENTEYPVRIFRLEERYASWGNSTGCVQL